MHALLSLTNNSAVHLAAHTRFLKVASLLLLRLPDPAPAEDLVLELVTVAGIHRVDCDQRHVPHVGATRKAGGFHFVRLGDHVIGKAVGNAVLVNGY